MSTLSFREQAAITFAAAPLDDGNAYLDGNPAEEAQRLARECCKAWGHDIPDLDCSGMSHAAAEYAIAKTVCRRCGAKP